MRFILAIMVAFSFSAAYAEITAGSGGCETGVNHVPSADIAYHDGVDAQGWAVAGADVNAPALGSDDFKDVNIGLNVPATNYLDEEKVNADLSRSDIQLGSIHVDTQQGGVDLNGKPLAATSPDCMHPAGGAQ